MPRSWFGRRRRSRGASAPEYAIGAGVLAVALLGALSALEDAADEQYDDEQALIATPVTDTGGSATTTTVGGSGTTVTLPPALTTTTTAPPATTTTTAAPATTTSTTGTTIPTYVVAASGSGANQNANFWRATVSITVSPARSGPVSGTYRENGTGTAESWSCTAGSGGTCTFTTGNLSRASVASVVFTVTTAASATPNNLPVTAPANRP